MNAATGMPEEAVDEARTWTEVFTLFQQNGRDDRGAAYALAMGALTKRSESIDQQLEALRVAEARLLTFASEEASPQLPASVSEASRARGHERAGDMCSKVRDAAAAAAAAERPWSAAESADRYHSEALQSLAAKRQTQAGIEEKNKAEAEAKAKRRAEVYEKKGTELAEAERKALQEKGLNGRCLPVRAGLPPCGFFMRTGTCKNGKLCKWDHPELSLNSKGYPLRPGARACALYQRTQACKFGAICTFDHPEPTGPVQEMAGAVPSAVSKVSAQQHQLQLLLHLQQVQELPAFQDPEAMMNVWCKFRVTFSLNG